MPKLSVSVPDDLWEAARQHSGFMMKTSELVQAALRLYVGGSRTVARPDDSDERFAEVLRGLVEGYEHEHQRGYAGAMEAAEIVGLRGLEFFSGSQENFYSSDWVGSLFARDEALRRGWPEADDYADPGAYEADIERLKELCGEVWASKAFRAGALQAFTDLWTALQVPTRYDEQFTEEISAVSRRLKEFEDELDDEEDNEHGDA